MKLTIVLRKEVTDKTAAENLVNFVKDKLKDYPEVDIKASTSDNINPNGG